MLDATQCGIVSYNPVLGTPSIVVNVDTTGSAMVMVSLPGVSTKRVEKGLLVFFFSGEVSVICLATVTPQLQQYCKLCTATRTTHFTGELFTLKVQCALTLHL